MSEAVNSSQTYANWYIILGAFNPAGVSNKAAAEVARLRSTTHIRRQMLSCWAWGEWDGEERGDAGNWEAIQMHELEMKPKRVFKLVFGTAILQITYICI